MNNWLLRFDISLPQQQTHIWNIWFSESYMWRMKKVTGTHTHTHTRCSVCVCVWAAAWKWMQKLEILLWVEGKLTLNIDCREVIMGRLWRSEPRLLKQEREKKKWDLPHKLNSQSMLWALTYSPDHEKYIFRKEKHPHHYTDGRKKNCVSNNFKNLH